VFHEILVAHVPPLGTTQVPGEAEIVPLASAVCELSVAQQKKIE
jgi:hypothetical protein